MQLIDDFRFSLRLLRKTPLFTFTTVIIIVLGLSLYMTSYSFEQVMTDKPLPYPDGERYVALKTIDSAFDNEGGRRNHNSFTYNFLKARAQSYSEIYAYNQSSFVLSDGDYARTFQGASLEHGFLTGTHVNPVLGRIFAESDSLPGAEAVVIIGESIWRDYYGADRDIIGKVSTLNGAPATVIGVMPADFSFPEVETLWIPISIPESTSPAGGISFTADFPLALVSILKSGVSLDSASVELSGLMTQLETDYPDLFANRTDYVVPYIAVNQARDFNLGRIMSFITLVILSLAVINLSSLLFIRSYTRQHELAVRSSVGATGWELAKQVLLESFIICFAGVVASIVLSAITIEVLNFLLVNSMGVLPFWFHLSLNSDIVLIGSMYAVVVWLVSGLPIAFRVYFSQPSIELSGSEKGGQKKSRSIIMKGVVGTEVILSFFLLVCCGVILYIANQVTTADYGVDPNEYMMGRIDLNGSDYQSEIDRTNYARELIRQVEQVSEVKSAVVTTAAPGKFGAQVAYQLEDRNLEVEEALPRAQAVWISDNYFQELGIDILSGREFAANDSVDSLQVAVISQQFSNLLWPNESVIGKRIGLGAEDSTQWLTIVGVAQPILQSAFNLSSVPSSIYRPLSQDTPRNLSLLAQIEPTSDILNIERELRLASASVDRNVAVDNFRILQREIHLNQSGLDVIKPIFSTFALATFILAGVGIYGVIARSISLQTQEIGIRRALGSADFKIIWRFLKQGLLFLLVGMLLGGAAASVISATTLSSLSSSSSVAVFLPPILILVAVLMGALIFSASYLPTRKAIQMEPGDALRYE
ncbi:MAG: hypothetical protein COB20_09870 [SAR86 cluster bacterium]|uniref:ABC transporter permease n=1 Tax=SAR86 cluster bacterium TaxID=2030880 RepID=A0A2A4X222_9GAMM|nr:MAG: hypothetical protein COB20_09870 [SAR86 cluster bacterium]